MANGQITTTNSGDVRQPEQARERPRVAPRVDVYENEDEILLAADLPGVKKEDVNIRFDRTELYLHAPREFEAPGAPLATELGPMDYERAFRVPQGVNHDQVKADFHDGVLWVHLPKAEETKPKTIPIQGG